MKISDYYPVDHEDGSVDERYRVSLWESSDSREWLVFPWRFHFCGEFVSCHGSRCNAFAAAREHNRKRLKQ